MLKLKTFVRVYCTPLDENCVYYIGTIILLLLLFRIIYLKWCPQNFLWWNIESFGSKWHRWTQELADKHALPRYIHNTDTKWHYTDKYTAETHCREEHEFINSSGWLNNVTTLMFVNVNPTLKKEVIVVICSNK